MTKFDICLFFKKVDKIQVWLTSEKNGEIRYLIIWKKVDKFNFD